jgi:hypothetical protein
MNNPWSKPAPSYMSPLRVLTTCGVDDRIRLVKETDDPATLRAMIDHPNTQKTVRQAAERRLRKLSRPLRPSSPPASTP